jgi:hypothetical protein
MNSYYGTPLEMNPEVRAMWIAALVSGAYKKTVGRLHRLLGGKKGQDRWCCLGVLCDLAIKAGVNVPITSNKEREERWGREFDGKVDYLPDSVMAWAGLSKCNPMVYGDVLSIHNDGGAGHPGGRSLRTIAAMIGGTYKGRL